MGSVATGNEKNIQLLKRNIKNKGLVLLLVVFLFILQYASLTYKQVTASQCKIARLFSSSCLLPDNYTEAQVMFGPHHCTLVTDLTVHYIMWYSQKSAGQLRRERVPGEVLVLLYKVQKAACGSRRGQLLQLGGVSLWRSQLLGSCFLASTAVFLQGSEGNVRQ